MAGKTPQKNDAEKKRKRADTQDKDRHAKRHRQQDEKLAAKTASDASDLKDNALKVLADLKTGALDSKHLNGKDGAVANPPADRWTLSSPVGGRIADIDPVFSVDEKHLILTHNTSLKVYTVADSLLVRQISLPIATKGKDGHRKTSAWIVSTWLSPAEPDFVWIACSDGRIWKVDWRRGTNPEDTMQVKSSSILDMSVSSFKLKNSAVDVLFVSEHKKQECNITAYYRVKGSQLSTVLFRTQQPDQRIHLVRSTSDGKFVVGASAEGLVVGSVQIAEGKSELEGEFYAFDTPDIVCALDMKVTAKSAAATPKKQTKKQAFEAVDLIAGCARGQMLVYNDIVNNLHGMKGSKSKSKKEEIQARKFHWHRRAVHSLKWSSDGNYMISGGSENSLVLWQVDTGKTTHLPHLSGSVENITVSPSGSSYAVHLDDNSAMIVSTSEMKPTFYVSGVQSAARYFTQPKDSLVFRLTDVSQEVRTPVPAVLDPRDPSRLHVCVGAGQQAVMAGSHQSAPILQSVDLETLRSVSKQALARTQPTDVNISSKGNAISEPAITHIAFSSDGNHLASVDDWQPPMRDIENMTAETREQFLQDRREVFLKFWTVGEGEEQLALTSRINSPHSTSRPEPILSLAADPASPRFATLGDDGLVRIWSFRTRQRDGLTATDTKGQALQSWSCTLTVGMGSNVGADVLPTTEGARPDQRHGSLSFSEDGSTLFVAFGGRGDGTVYVVDTHTGELRATLENMWKGTVRRLEVLSPYVIILSDDLRVYDVVADELQYGVLLPKAEDPTSTSFTHLAVDKRSRALALVVPGKDSSEVAVFKPEEPQPLCMETIPHRVLSLVSSRSSSGFLALDDAAQLWTVAESSDQAAVSLSRPLEDLRLDNVVIEESDEDNVANGVLSMGEDDEASEDEGADKGDGMDLDDDDDETHAAVVSRQKLAELFDAAPAFAMPSIEDMFYKVTDLIGGKPLATS